MPRTTSWRFLVVAGAYGDICMCVYNVRALIIHIVKKVTFRLEFDHFCLHLFLLKALKTHSKFIVHTS